MDVGSITYYSISPRIMNLLVQVHYQLGEVHARQLQLPPAGSAKTYRASTVHATLAIEGGLLDPHPVAALAEDHTAGSQGPAALEAVNTHRTYDLLASLDPFAEQDLRQAHGVLMHGLAVDAGRYRTGPMEVFYGDPQPLRTAPAKGLPVAVQDLLQYSEEDDFPPLLTSCVLHFGMVYLRPFTAGNGRLARLWQRRLLMRHWPVFAYLPVEAFIHNAEPAYHAALEFADRRGDCGGFITYMLEQAELAVDELFCHRKAVEQQLGGIELFLHNLQRGGDDTHHFRRRDYMAFHPRLSTATATRDLRDAVVKGRLSAFGSGRSARYTQQREIA